MAAEWVPVLGTVAGGLIGVVGTLGATVLNERRELRGAARQRAYAVADTRRDERKAAYIRFLDAVSAVESACRDLAVVARAGSDTNDRAGVALDLMHDLKRVLVELDLIGSRAVARQAALVFRDAAAMPRRALDPPYDWSLIPADTISDLVSLMAGDLADSA